MPSVKVNRRKRIRADTQLEGRRGVPQRKSSHQGFEKISDKDKRDAAIFLWTVSKNYKLTPPATTCRQETRAAGKSKEIRAKFKGTDGRSAVSSLSSARSVSFPAFAVQGESNNAMKKDQN